MSASEHRLATLESELMEARQALSEQTDEMERKEKEIELQVSELARKDGHIQRVTQDMAASQQEIASLQEQVEHLMSQSINVHNKSGGGGGGGETSLLNSSLGSDAPAARDALHAKDSQIAALKERVRQLEQAASEVVSKDSELGALRAEVEELQAAQEAQQRVAAADSAESRQSIMEEMMQLRENMKVTFGVV